MSGIEARATLSEHGTYARYVQKCRCDACRQACNEYRQRWQQLADNQALRLAKKHPQEPITRRVYMGRGRWADNKACPGPPGQECASGSLLRKDSVGGLCRRCRLRLIANDVVDAAPATRHLRKLARNGISYVQAARECGVRKTTCGEVRAGSKKRIRRHTLNAILSVEICDEIRSDGAQVPAGPTLRRLEELVAMFGSRAAVARELGYRTLALQSFYLVKRGATTVRNFNARRVEALHRQWCA